MEHFDRGGIEPQRFGRKRSQCMGQFAIGDNASSAERGQRPGCTGCRGNCYGSADAKRGQGIGNMPAKILQAAEKPLQTRGIQKQRLRRIDANGRAEPHQPSSQCFERVQIIRWGGRQANQLCMPRLRLGRGHSR